MYPTPKKGRLMLACQAERQAVKPMDWIQKKPGVALRGMDGRAQGGGPWKGWTDDGIAINIPSPATYN